MVAQKTYESIRETLSVIKRAAADSVVCVCVCFVVYLYIRDICMLYFTIYIYSTYDLGQPEKNISWLARMGASCQNIYILKYVALHTLIISGFRKKHVAIFNK